MLFQFHICTQSCWKQLKLGQPFSKKGEWITSALLTWSRKMFWGRFSYTGLGIFSKIGHKKRVCAYFRLHRSYSRLTFLNHPLPWAKGLHFALWPQHHHLRFPLRFLCTWLWQRKFLLSWNSHPSGEGNEHTAECCDENKHAKEQPAWLLQVGWSGGPLWRDDTETQPAPGNLGGGGNILSFE